MINLGRKYYEEGGKELALSEDLLVTQGGFANFMYVRGVGPLLL